MDARISSSPTGAAPANATGAATKSYILSGKVMLSAIVSLLTVVLLVLCLHIYSRWYFLRLARRRRLARAFARRAARGSGGGGLDPELLKSLPVFTYSPQQGKAEEEPPSPPPECAVCLCEFERRDHGRVLPACAHVFHAECIDLWFLSHSTCPLCRAPVEPAARKLDPAAAACRYGEEGGNAGAEDACSASTSSPGYGSPESSSSNSSITRSSPDLDFRTGRTGGVTEGGVDFDLERGEAMSEPTPPTANTTGSKTRSSS